MANVFSTFWTEIREAIAATWTDVLPTNSGGGIHRAVSVQKLDWQSIAAPYCVVIYSSRLADTLALRSQCYELEVEIVYIRADGTGTAAAIDTKLEALDDALYAYSFANGVQFVDVVAHDNTEANAANQIFLALNVPFSAGSLRCRFFVGETL